MFRATRAGETLRPDATPASGRRHDSRRRQRYARVFQTISTILVELNEIQRSRSHLNGEGERLLRAVLTLQSQLRHAMREGAAEDVELLQVLQDSWDRARIQLHAPPETPPEEALSARELDVLRGLAGGLANKQIALRLGISARTVRNHVSSIYQKLQVSGRAEAAVHAVRMGLVQP